MGKLIINYLFLLRTTFFAVIFLTINSCSSIEMISIKNNTNETIQFHGQFITQSGMTDNLNFTLKPGDNNLWRYEAGFLEKKNLDKGLTKIILENDSECKILLERDMIKKIAIKNGMWKINIDNKIMNCN